MISSAGRFRVRLRKPRLQWTILAFLGYLAISYFTQKTKGVFSKDKEAEARDDVAPALLSGSFHEISPVGAFLEPSSHWLSSRKLLATNDSSGESSGEKSPEIPKPSATIDSSGKNSEDQSSATPTPLSTDDSSGENEDQSSANRKPLVTNNSSDESSGEQSSELGQGWTNCTPPAIEQFPRPLMTKQTRRNGGLLIHLLATIYLFVAIAIVCDDFFVPSLEMICDRMNMSEDVAGATFMAAGSSAPELATAVIAVFVAKDDIGISGVIGSAVFNILFVISVCAIFAGQVVDINWWPLIRDSFCYCISICGLLLAIYNEEVTWYDSVFLLILYIFYIILMVNNRRMEAWAHTLNVPFKSATREEKSSLFGTNTTVSGVPQGEKDQQSTGINSQGEGMESQEGNGVKSIDTTEIEAAQPKSMVPERKNEDASPWEVPVGVWERIVWGTTLPIVTVHYVTVPDARKVKWRRWYIFTFIMSMLWIAVYSYIMVWMITIIGFTLGIPDTVMGLTLIAVGVSVPDALSSLCVVKQGFGDMAVSNAIGSNVFDILICLGLPWFLKTVVVDPGSIVPVESRGLTYSTLSLFSTVIFLVIVTHWNGWKLDVKYGVILLIWYLIFMVFASLYELNVFGNFNPPVCPSNY